MAAEHRSSDFVSEVVINGKTYVLKPEPQKGNRMVIVIDRGWIFAGDVTTDGDYLNLDNATWVFRWEEIGFSGVVANPKSDKVDLRQMSNPVQVPLGSVIFRIPVSDDWGL